MAEFPASSLDEEKRRNSSSSSPGDDDDAFVAGGAGRPDAGGRGQSLAVPDAMPQYNPELQRQAAPRRQDPGEERRRRERPVRVLLGITGSVAAVRGPELACALADALGTTRRTSSSRSNTASTAASGEDCRGQADDGDEVEERAPGGACVRVVLTRGGSHFWTRCAPEYDPAAWERLQRRLVTGQGERGGSSVDGDDDEADRTLVIYEHDREWKDWRTMGDPVLHVDLRDWADVLVVAPLSAHTLAKFAGGLCDDTLSCVFRAWWWPQPTHSATTPAAATGLDGSSRRLKPVVLAPAMNTGMWEHPITRRHLEEIKAFGGGGSTGSDVVRIVPPQVKTLACGETGDGALAAIPDIVQAVRASLGLAPSASRVLD